MVNKIRNFIFTTCTFLQFWSDVAGAWTKIIETNHRNIWRALLWFFYNMPKFFTAGLINVKFCNAKFSNIINRISYNDRMVFTLNNRFVKAVEQTWTEQQVVAQSKIEILTSDMIFAKRDRLRNALRFILWNKDDVSINSNSTEKGFPLLLMLRIDNNKYLFYPHQNEIRQRVINHWLVINGQ